MSNLRFFAFIISDGFTSCSTSTSSHPTSTSSLNLRFFEAIPDYGMFQKHSTFFFHLSLFHVWFLSFSSRLCFSFRLVCSVGLVNFVGLVSFISFITLANLLVLPCSFSSLCSIGLISVISLGNLLSLTGFLISSTSFLSSFCWLYNQFYLLLLPFIYLYLFIFVCTLDGSVPFSRVLFRIFTRTVLVFDWF